MNDAARFSLPEQLLRRIAALSFSWLSKRKRRIALSWRGQATVEGAFLIPVILLMLMLLIQPGILLYDRVVMQAAAAEGCRLVSTRPPGDSSDAYKGYVLRRLGSVPQQKNFHVHGGSAPGKCRLRATRGANWSR